MLIKKCIGIASGCEDNLGKIVFQGFMADYNMILQGKSPMDKK